MQGISRRVFLKSAGILSFMVLPGAGRIQARPFYLDEPQDYTGRICYNENPLGPSPLALQALRDEAALAHRYPDWLNKNVESAVADHLGLDAEQVCVGAGATEMIQKVADAFVGPGDEVILAQPSYNQIATEAVANGGAAVYVPVDENHIIDLTAILAAITDNTKLIFLVNPNNPLGKFIHKDDMASFMDQIPEGIAVCVDEAYNEYVENEDYESSIPYISEGFPVIVVRTFSKVFGLAGARIGYTLASADNTEQIEDVQLRATVSRSAHAAAISALNDSEHINATLNLNAASKTMLYNGFTNLGLEYIPSETNFMMVDCGVEAEPVVEALAELGFNVRTGWDMPQHIRVSTGLLGEMEGFLAALGTVIGTTSTPLGTPPAAPGIKSVYPNPFNQECRIHITTRRTEKVSLVIYDAQGRRVRTLVNKKLNPGIHNFSWDGKNALGQAVVSGVYMLNMIQGEFASTRSIQLLK